MSEKVSIIMPSCNDYMYISEAVGSILNQTYQDLELIIVDGSDDSERMKKLVCVDPRVKYFYREKRGIADALNFAVDHANGEYIARMDADDVAKNDRIKKQIDYLYKHKDIDILGTSYEIIDECGNIKEKRHLPKENDEILAKLIFDNPICHPTVMFRKSVFDGGLRYGNVYAEDYDLWTRLIFRYKFANLDENLLSYRKHDRNASLVGECRVFESDACSCRVYLEKLFGQDFDEFSNVDLMKNYRFFGGEDIISGCKEDFFLKQYELIKRIHRMSANCMAKEKRFIQVEIDRRWNYVCSLISVFDQELSIFLNSQSYRCDYDGKSTLATLLRKNELYLSRIKKEKHTFYLYGFGVRGKKTLDKYIKSNCEWNLKGIIDQRKSQYLLNGEKRTTVQLDMVIEDEYDFIIVSAKKQYEEIRAELIDKKVSENKIIRDAFFYYSED